MIDKKDEEKLEGHEKKHLMNNQKEFDSFDSSNL